MAGRARDSSIRNDRRSRSAAHAARRRRNVSRRGLQLPPRRALIGGALVALAAVGVFVAHRSANAPVTSRYVVAARDIPAGHTVTGDDLGTIALDLPSDVAAVPSEDAAELVGRVTTKGLAELELVSPGDVFARNRFSEDDAVEVAVDLPGARALGGLIGPGSVVDVLVTDVQQGGTRVLAQSVRVASVDESPSSGIGSNGAVRVVLSLSGTDEARSVVDASLTSDLTLVLPRPTSGGDR